MKLLEKDWLGIQVQMAPRRHYPLGKVAGDIIGYIGAINRKEYESILQEIKSLQVYLQECDEGNELEPPKGIQSEAQARKRLQELQGHAYSINDYVGKAGIEGRFEQDLRGYHGKKTFYSDARGNFLRELPGTREPLSGQRFLLTISAELQAYCEKLLTQNERIREARASKVDAIRQALLSMRQPWIKGGAIVAMDPHTGEVLAMASYPRFDPNDFIVTGQPEINRQRRSNIARWFESENYIGEIWDQKRPLERELYDDENEAYHEDSKIMDWDHFIDSILPKSSPVKEALSRIGKVSNAIELQQQVETLLTLSGQDNAYRLFNVLYQGQGHIIHGASMPSDIKRNIEDSLQAQEKLVGPLKKKMDRYFVNIPHNYDKLLLVDLCRVAVRPDFFSHKILDKAGRQSLAAYRDATAAKVLIAEEIRSMAKEIFHEQDFKAWRQANEKSFLKQKRAEEKSLKIYPKPYIEYLDAEEARMFQAFWEAHEFRLMLSFLNGVQFNIPELQPYSSHFLKWHEEISKGAHQKVHWRHAYIILQKAVAGMEPDQTESYLKTLRGFHDLDRPLLGRYRHLRKQDNIQLEKHLAAAFYPTYGYGYGRSQGYRQAASQGSIFKLVTAYAALKQKHEEFKGDGVNMKKLNPLEITDHTHREGKELYVGYHADGKPLPRSYKGGRLPRSTHSIGKIDLLKAIETSSNPYFSLLAGDFLKSPEDLARVAKLFSYGSCTGIDLPAEITGIVPNDLLTNRTGLYSMAIGQHSLVVTPLQTATMLSAIANAGKVLKPKIVKVTAGRQPPGEEDPVPCKREFKLQKDLALAGVDFPLFTALKEGKKESVVHLCPTVVKREIFMPEIIRKMLLEGMRRVVVKTQEESLGALSRFYRDYPEAISDYIDLKEDLVGKTSTAESMENIDLDIANGTNMYTHVWFGGISFNREFKETNQKKFVFNNKFGEPELVVVVYLRFGIYGKEAAPMAAQVVKKWREIKQKHGLSGQ